MDWNIGNWKGMRMATSRVERGFSGAGGRSLLVDRYGRRVSQRKENKKRGERSVARPEEAPFMRNVLSRASIMYR
jgi:hypothetical protein